MFGKWKEYIRGRFSDREELDKESAYKKFWFDLPASGVMSFFKEIEDFYFLSPGLLRPEDDVKKLVEPDKRTKWYKPIPHELRFGELETELASQLKKRIRAAKLSISLDEIQTIDDLVHVWCGHQLKRGHQK